MSREKNPARPETEAPSRISPISRTSAARDDSECQVSSAAGTPEWRRVSPHVTKDAVQGRDRILPREKNFTAFLRERPGSADLDVRGLEFRVGEFQGQCFQNGFGVVHGVVPPFPQKPIRPRTLPKPGRPSDMTSFPFSSRISPAISRGLPAYRKIPRISWPPPARRSQNTGSTRRFDPGPGLRARTPES